MSSLTDNLGLYKPSDGDGNLNNQNWSDEVNANFDTLDAVAGHPNVGVRYVDGFRGDNANDGRTWGTAKKDIVGAYDSVADTGPLGLVGWGLTIYVTSQHTGSGEFTDDEVQLWWDYDNQDRGLWIVGPHSAKYAGCPKNGDGVPTGPDVDGYRAQMPGGLRIIAVSDVPLSGAVGMPRATQLINGPTAQVANTPALLIAGTNAPHYFEGIRIVDLAQPVLLGVDPDDFATHVNTAQIKFEYCYFQNSSTVTTGTIRRPAVEIGYAFWIWFDHCVFSSNRIPFTSTSVALDAGTTYTFTTANDHGLSVGDVVDAQSFTPSGYNGNWTVSAVPTASTFKADIGTNPAAVSVQGTISWLLSDRRAGVGMLSETGDTDGGYLKFTNCIFVQGGFRYAAVGTGGWGNIAMEDCVMEGDFSNDQPPIFHFVPLASGAETPNSSSGGIRLENVDGADGTWPFGIVRTVGAVRHAPFVTVTSSGTAVRGGVIGPHLNLNSRLPDSTTDTAGAIPGPILGFPYGTDRRIYGLANKNWAGSPAHARYVNLANQTASAWSSAFGATTVTPGVADPYGGTNAATLSAAGAGGSQPYIATRSVADGDWIIGGCWTRISSTGLSTPWTIGLGGALYFDPAGQIRGPASWPANDWRWNTIMGRVVGTDSVDVNITLRCDGSITPSFAYPLLLHIPAADGWTETELWSYLDGLETFSNRQLKGEIGTESRFFAGNGVRITEQTDISAPSANQVVIYARDTGGKTELVARFASGAIQQIAIEP